MNAIFYIVTILIASSLFTFAYLSWLNYKAISRTNKEGIEKPGASDQFDFAHDLYN